MKIISNKPDIFGPTVSFLNLLDTLTNKFINKKVMTKQLYTIVCNLFFADVVQMYLRATEWSIFCIFVYVKKKRAVS